MCKVCASVLVWGGRCMSCGSVGRTLHELWHYSIPLFG
jgi:hypothetical protein